MSNRKLVLTVTAKQCREDRFRCSGAGGQNVAGHPDYSVCDCGTVWSHKYGKLRRLRRQWNGHYWQHTLSTGGKAHTVSVHRLVAEAFLGSRADGFVVCHDDSNVDNCAAWNLRLDTQRGNISDKVANGTNVSNPGSINGQAKLHESVIPAIRALRGGGAVEVGRAYGVAPRTIRDIWNGKTWTHV